MGLSYWGRERLSREWRKLKDYRYHYRYTGKRPQRAAIDERNEQPLRAEDCEDQQGQGGPSSDTPSNKIMAFFTGLLFVTSVFQWQRTGDQIASSEKIASENSKETQAALKVSQGLANSASQQVTALRDLAAATRVQAGAADRTALATSEQLALAQAAKVDLAMQVITYQRGATIEIAGRISNQGSSTVVGDSQLAFMPMAAGSDFSRIWENKLIVRSARAIEVVPGVPRLQIMKFEDPTDEQWALLSSGQVYLVSAVRYTFKDSKGVERTLEACITVTGPPENAKKQNCERR